MKSLFTDSCFYDMVLGVQVFMKKLPDYIFTRAELHASTVTEK